MKYVILCIAMLCCFAFAGSRASTAATMSPSAPAIEAVDDGDDGDAAVSCGGNTCSKGTYCCNASCGICVPKGMLCTQQAC